MFKSVLLPLDLGDAPVPDRVFEAAVNLARTNSAELHIVTVLPDFGMSIVGSFFDEGFEKKALKKASDSLAAFVEKYAPGDLTITPHVAHGTIYDEIIRAANKLNCDVIVMASHRPDLKDYLLGPNAARVMRHAKQSVFVVRD